MTPDLEPDDTAQLTAFQRDILTVIAAHHTESGEYPYGLAIKRSLEDYRQTAVNHGRVLQSLTGPSETTGTQSGSVSVWTLQSLTGPSETWADVDFTGPESSASIPHRSV